MAALNRSIEIKWLTSNNETDTKTYKHIVPTATAASLKSAIQGVTTLTTSTYVDAYVIDTTSLNELAPS